MASLSVHSWIQPGKLLSGIWTEAGGGHGPLVGLGTVDLEPTADQSISHTVEGDSGVSIYGMPLDFLQNLPYFCSVDIGASRKR